jgi:hypothetical protein
MCVDPCPRHLEDVGQLSTTVHLKGDTPLIHCGLAGHEFELLRCNRHGLAASRAWWTNPLAPRPNPRSVMPNTLAKISRFIPPPVTR